VAEGEGKPPPARALHALVLLILAALYLVGLGKAHLLEPDEGRYADVARSFRDGGSLVVPSANGVPFLDKPPLVPWLGALSLRALGADEHGNALALRLVPALFSLLAAVAAGELARAAYGRGAWSAALVYGTAPLALGVGRTFTLDAPLTALAAAGALLVLRGAGTFGGRGSHLLGVLGGVVIGLATLVKGPVAIGLVGLALVSALVLAPTRRLFSPLPWIVAVLVAAPWYAAVVREEPGFARAFFWEENIRRFAGVPTEHIHGPFFFLGTLGWGLGGGAAAGLALLATVPPIPRGARVLVAWGGLVVAFFSLSSTKVETYILPALPALAAVIGAEIEIATCERSGPVWRALVWAFLAACGVLALASVGAALFALGAFPSGAEHAAIVREAISPGLALLPLAGVACALAAARKGRPRVAYLGLAASLLLAGPAGAAAFERVSYLKSAEPAADLVLAARRPGERVASYHFYYRGLPYFLGTPVTLLGELNELRVDSFRERPDLYMPDLYFLAGSHPVIDDCWTRSFLAWQRPLLVVMPQAQRRPERFLDACARAGLKAEKRGERGEDVLFEVLP
jgi:4-amino-4-deoxy-L-arabinose transferase-like glycosyltransferase